MTSDNKDLQAIEAELQATAGKLHQLEAVQEAQEASATEPTSSERPATPETQASPQPEAQVAPTRPADMVFSIGTCLHRGARPTIVGGR